MHAKVQCAPLIPLSEQCHTPNLIMLVVFACSCVFQGGEALWGFGGFVPLVHYCFYVCGFQKSRSMKFNAQWSSTCAISSFKWTILCPWPSYVGVFYLFMCFSWSWSVCEALVVSCLLFSSMIKTLMFCVCIVLFMFNVVLCV
jgi:hypothetical protein